VLGKVTGTRSYVGRNYKISMSDKSSIASYVSLKGGAFDAFGNAFVGSKINANNYTTVYLRNSVVVNGDVNIGDSSNI